LIGKEIRFLSNGVLADISERYRYRPEDIVMLTDDSTNPRQIPNKANIIQAMHWLVQGARPDDALFFH
jgi:hypothetical protein